MLIRLSPSGPPIANESGGTADVGPGFPLRMVEGTTVVNGGVWTPSQNYECKIDPFTPDPPYLRPTLTNPSPDRQYRVTGAVDIINTGAGTATVTATIEVSYDDAATWNTLVIQESTINQSQAKHVRIDQPLTLGSALNEPVPAVAPDSMQVRLLMRSNIPDIAYEAPGGTSGAALVQLMEAL
jgi:hypothetical protein